MGTSGDGGRGRRLWGEPPPESAIRPPAPWSAARFLAAGGVFAAGWTSADHLLLVSHAGYGVLHLAANERVLRDRDAGLTYDALSDDWHWFIIPATGERVALFGPAGTTGHMQTGDGWRLEVQEVPHQERRQPRVLLHGPGGAEPFLLQEEYAGTYVGASFSPSGRFLVLVDTASQQVHLR